MLLMPPVHLHSGVCLPSRIGWAGGKGLVTNLLIGKDVLNADLMGYNNVMVSNNYLVVGSSLLGSRTGSWVSSSELEVLFQGMCRLIDKLCLLGESQAEGICSSVFAMKSGKQKSFFIETRSLATLHNSLPSWSVLFYFR